MLHNIVDGEGNAEGGSEDATCSKNQVKEKKVSKRLALAIGLRKRIHVKKRETPASPHGKRRVGPLG